MSNINKTIKKNNGNIHHSANFLVSSFLLSQRSLKKIYNLNPTAIAILRYICDSIDLTYKKTKSFQTKLSQSQISEYCHCSLRTISTHIKLLTRKRFLIFNEETLVYKVGCTLFAYANSAYPLDIRKSCVPPRYTQNLRTSNVSNFSNSCSASVTSQTTSFNSNNLMKPLSKKQKQKGSKMIGTIKNLIKSKNIGKQL